MTLAKKVTKFQYFIEDYQKLKISRKAVNELKDLLI